jgi:hypothetical protein
MKREAFEQFVRSIFASKDAEVLCSEFFEALPRFVDLQLAGQNAAAALPEAAHHLGQCPECNEVYLALLQALRSEDSADPT